mmetsp:Transcript_35250/g.110988  ORF Transcript_35250/g.110988 Transcript_35250/m.110988 type:complete len:216 (-) Transcript_35250:891-1538(-)
MAAEHRGRLRQREQEGARDGVPAAGLSAAAAGRDAERGLRALPREVRHRGGAAQRRDPQLPRGHRGAAGAARGDAPLPAAREQARRRRRAGAQGDAGGRGGPPRAPRGEPRRGRGQVRVPFLAERADDGRERRLQAPHHALGGRRGEAARLRRRGDAGHRMGDVLRARLRRVRRGAQAGAGARGHALRGEGPARRPVRGEGRQEEEGQEQKGQEG